MTDLFYTIIIITAILLVGFFGPLFFVSLLDKANKEKKLKTVQLLQKAKKPLQFFMPVMLTHLKNVIT